MRASREVRWAAAVLAGGASSRMGRDKALLEIEGVTMLDRAMRVCAEAGAAEVWISGARYDHGVADLEGGRGPMAGVASSLGHARERSLDVLVVVPVDMPRLRPVRLEELISGLDDGSECARFEPSPLPLSARVSQRAIETATEAARAAGSIRGWLAELGVRTLPIEARDELANINTPDEWSRLRRPG